MTRTHYRDLNKPAAVDFSFLCTHCSSPFTAGKPTRTCPRCRVGAMRAGQCDPELVGEMSGV